MLKSRKSAYVCGPLTELSKNTQERVKQFYSDIGDVCEQTLGVRAFVPHEHYDPIANKDFTPQDIDIAERYQVCENTSILIVAAIAPSWGGGIEVEMANQNKVPVILLCQKKKLAARKISRLLRGNPAVKATIEYTYFKDALAQLRLYLARQFSRV